MFALAVYDKEERRLTLVRDRLGQKPLYWTQLSDGTLLFASELAGILVHPKVERRLHSPALAELLLSEYISAPNTIYENIHKLEAGCLLEASQEGIHLRRWWTPPLPGQSVDSRLSAMYATERSKPLIDYLSSAPKLPDPPADLRWRGPPGKNPALQQDSEPAATTEPQP